MGDRRAGRFRLGRRRGGTEAAEPGPPCLPCAQQAALRPFALDPRTTERIGEDFVASLDPVVADAIVEGEVVLFDRRRHASSLLNSTAALIWASVDGTASVGQIADDLARETGADRDRIVADVRDTFARFIAASVILDPAAATTGVEAAPGVDGDRAAPDGAAGARAERRRQRVGRVLASRPWRFDELRQVAGATVAIRTDGVELADVLASALAHLPGHVGGEPAATISILDRGAPSTRRLFRVLRDDETVRVASSVDEALDDLFRELNDVAIGDPGDRLVLRAGAAEQDGDVVVVAGASSTGTSTLTAALVRAGWRYLGDDVVAIDPTTHEVLPYPKPFALDDRSCELLGIVPAGPPGTKATIAVDAVGKAGRANGRVALLVLLVGPQAATPPPGTAGQRLVELLGCTYASTFDRFGGPQPALDAMVAFTASVPVLVLERLAIDEAVRTVTDQIATLRSPGRLAR